MNGWDQSNTISGGQTRSNDDLKVNASDGGDQIFWSFAALTSGFAFAISSRPADLKSKVHPWTSGYLWAPQKVVPHRHLNPVNPTRFLHVVHRFGRFCCCSGGGVTVFVAVTSSSADGFRTRGWIIGEEMEMVSGDGGDTSEREDSTVDCIEPISDDGGDTAEREDSTVDFMEACCCLRQRSP